MHLYDTTQGGLKEIACKEDESGLWVFDPALYQQFIDRVIEARDRH